MRRTLNIDELNLLVAKQYAEDKENINELVENLLITSYIHGREDVEDMLDYFDIQELAPQTLRDALEKKIDGKTVNDRVNEYKGQNEALAKLQRVVTTECHRMYNTGAFDTAKQIEEESGLVITKTWRTMNDDRVRDSHDYLEGKTVRLGEKFYTWDGKSAEYPAQFGVPEEDVNCRCVIDYGMENG